MDNDSVRAEAQPEVNGINFLFQQPTLKLSNDMDHLQISQGMGYFLEACDSQLCEDWFVWLRQAAAMPGSLSMRNICPARPLSCLCFLVI